MAVGSMDRSEEFGGLDSEPEGQNLASGKRLHNHGKCQFLIGKLTINGHFQ